MMVSDITCHGGTATIIVDVNNLNGSATININGPMNMSVSYPDTVSSPYTLGGIVAGTYDVVVTDEHLTTTQKIACADQIVILHYHL